MQSIDATVFVHPSAHIYGAVTIAAHSSIWINAAMRAECQQIRIGQMSNIQDFVMIHVGYEHPTIIGDFVSVAHHAIVHGAVIEDECLIGLNATLMDGVVIGRGSIVAGGAFCKEGSVFPPNSIIAGIPAKAIRERDSRHANRMNAWQYYRNAQHYRANNHRAWHGPDYEAWLETKWAEIQTGADRLPGEPQG
ncbi:MAG TPA: gamma carbonic anhydrase family protein [Terriglobales bacterium]|nr:gamma carbonic anhydrase family protein [Terriglobales bacterium]